MSTTTEQIARSALGALSSDASFLLACSWVSERYQNLVSRIRFKHLRKPGEFTAPAAITTGTVAVTQGTNIVVGTSTTWTPTIVGRHFRGANSWYKIAAFISPTELRLESIYSEATLTAGAYVIAARFITLDPIVRWLGNTIVMSRTRWYYNAIPFEHFDIKYPSRIIQHSARPLAWAEVGSSLNVNDKLCKQIEIYPALTSDELFNFVYWELPTELKEPSSPIPPEIDLTVLKEGVLIDVMRDKMAQAEKANNIEAAALWRNEYRAQQTTWEKEITRAMIADKGVDDGTFILQSLSHHAVGDITTARDDVYSRGNWP